MITLSSAAITWLLIGERGASSDTMFGTFIGVPFCRDEQHPYDPSDLLRCVKLLRDVPEFRGRMEEMRNVSSVWSRFVDHWDELTSLLADEMADGVHNATRTYDLMLKIRANHRP